MDQIAHCNIPCLCALPVSSGTVFVTIVGVEAAKIPNDLAEDPFKYFMGKVIDIYIYEVSGVMLC